MTNSFLVTVYKLSLGEYNSVTGIPARGYTPTSAEVIIAEKGGAVARHLGIYSSADASALTKYDIDEGDIIMDNYDSENPRFWLVLGRTSQTIGSTFIYYMLNMSRMERPNFHILSTSLYGFEVISDSLRFEEGFERLYLTL